MPPWLAQQRNPAMSPNTKGKEQAPVTLENISGENNNNNNNKAQGGGGGEWLKEPHRLKKTSTKET